MCKHFCKLDILSDLKSFQPRKEHIALIFLYVSV